MKSGKSEGGENESARSLSPKRDRPKAEGKRNKKKSYVDMGCAGCRGAQPIGCLRKFLFSMQGKLLFSYPNL